MISCCALISHAHNTLLIIVITAKILVSFYSVFDSHSFFLRLLMCNLIKRKMPKIAALSRSAFNLWPVFSFSFNWGLLETGMMV